MKTVEYGQEHQEVILLLHGGGLNWWSCRAAAKRLAERWHVVMPVLDGHAGSGRPFVSMESCARAVLEMIDRRFSGRVAMIGGLSLGAQVLTEMLILRPDVCRCAIIESALAIPMPVTAALVDPMTRMSYGLIRRRWFAKLQFRYLGIPAELFEEYYRDTCGIACEDMRAFLRTNAGYAVREEIGRTKARVLVCVGGREGGVMLRSARRLHALIPGSTLRIMKGYSHGNFSLSHPEEYVQTVCGMMDELK